MPIPDDWDEPDRNYRVRGCQRVADAPIVGFFTGSKVHMCDRCDEPIWLDENQIIPDAGLEIHGDIAVCLQCLMALQEEADEPVVWLNPPPPGLDNLT